MHLEDQRESYKGEAHGLRAFYYLQMIKNYGGVPIILDDPSAEGYDFSKLRRATFSECARQIISDCRISMEIRHWDGTLGHPIVTASGGARR